MTDSSKAVFLSYASQDAAAARRISEALRAAAIEVWFDQSELRGGDSWDRQIRKQIHDCALFIPIISATTQGRLEGYFRREWRVAVDRTHDMADGKPFLVPVVIDDTTDQDAEVPESFRAVQWTRLPAGQASPALVERVSRLLAPDQAQVPAQARPPAGVRPGTPAAEASKSAPSSGSSWRSRPAPLLLTAVVVIAAGYFGLDRLLQSKRPAAGTQIPASVAQPAAPGHGVISDKSIAVLPFVDMSERKDQEYFSDGLSEELIDLLSKIPDLRVPARTSSFYFKGKAEDIAAIANKLRVAHVLEGSIRKSGSRLRVTAQLVRADDGYHLWSETYDRKLDDIFKVQDEIASAVVSALRLKLLSAPTTRDRQTANTDAYTQYLIGRQILLQNNWAADTRAAGAFRRALALDPDYALAWAGLADALDGAAEEETSLQRFEARKRDALAAAEKAVALRPDLADGFAERGHLRAWSWRDFVGAEADFQRALKLEPDSPAVRSAYAISVLVPTGRLDEALLAAQRLTEADPLNAAGWRTLGTIRLERGELGLAREALSRSLEISAAQSTTPALVGYAFLLEGRPADALAIAPHSTAELFRLHVMSMAQHDLGHEAESRRLLDEMIAKNADFAAYQIAESFAWRGEVTHAFEWLDRAYVQRDSGLSVVKVDPLLKRLHADPRFAAVLRKMNLPE